LTFACVSCCDEGVDRFIEEAEEEGIDEPVKDDEVSSVEGPGPADGVEDSAVL
jgi:hypothetical protein